MDIYKTVIKNSTTDEIAELIKNMADETEKYRNALYAAKAFIDCNVSDPNITTEIQDKYALYEASIRGC